MYRRRFFLFPLALGLSALLAACSSGGGGGNPTERPASYTPPAAEASATPEGYPLPPETPPTSAPPQPYPQPTEAGAVAPPTPRQELTATDPASVQLASGQVQLLEFFAFW